MPLDVYLFPTQTARLPHDVFSTRIYVLNYFASVKPIKLLHLTQNKSGTVSTIPLDVYFFQRRRHDCRRAFSLLESVHRIAPPASSLSSCCISHKTKAVQFPPYRLMFILSNADDTTSTRRFFYSNLCIELFRQCGLIPIMQSSNAKQKRQGFTRICASNYFASTDNSNLANLSGKLLHLTQNKSGRASTHTA